MKADRIASVAAMCAAAAAVALAVGLVAADFTMKSKARQDMNALAATMHDPAMSIAGDMWGCADPADAMIREEVERTLLEEGGRCSSFRAPWTVSDSAEEVVRLTVFPARGKTVEVWTLSSDLPL